MNNTKKQVSTYRYKIQMRYRKDEEARQEVYITGKYAGIDHRGTLYFYNSSNAITPNVIAAFQSGSWVSFEREEIPQ